MGHTAVHTFSARLSAFSRWCRCAPTALPCCVVWKENHVAIRDSRTSAKHRDEHTHTHTTVTPRGQARNSRKEKKKNTSAPPSVAPPHAYQQANTPPTSHKPQAQQSQPTHTAIWKLSRRAGDCAWRSPPCWKAWLAWGAARRHEHSSCRLLRGKSR